LSSQPFKFCISVFSVNVFEINIKVLWTKPKVYGRDKLVPLYMKKTINHDYV